MNEWNEMAFQRLCRNLSWVLPHITESLPHPPRLKIFEQTPCSLGFVKAKGTPSSHPPAAQGSWQGRRLGSPVRKVLAAVLGSVQPPGWHRDTRQVLWFCWGQGWFGEGSRASGLERSVSRVEHFPGR